MGKALRDEKAVVCELIDTINRHEWSRLEALVAPDFVRHSFAAPGVTSRDALLEFLRREVEAFPDAAEEVEDMLAEGDRVVVRSMFTGTQRGPLGPYPPSGRVLRARSLAIYRVRGGQIQEAWAEWDNLAGLSQLGHLTPRTDPR